MKYVYPCVLHPEEGDGFRVSFPDVRGANTSGATREEALEMAKDALVAALGGYSRVGEEIPLPSPITDGAEPVQLQPLASAKVALNSAMREQGVTDSALAHELGVSIPEVHELLNPDHDSHVSLVEQALRAVGSYQAATTTDASFSTLETTSVTPRES